MTDRIANPWRERTPFERDGEWPVRLDQYPEAGTSEDDVDRWVQTASILQSNGDTLDIVVRSGRRDVKVYRAPDIARGACWVVRRLGI